MDVFHAANSCTHSARCRWTSATAWWIPKRRRTERRHQNCLQYISTHLHEELRLEELAHECGLRSRSSTAITRTAHTNRRKEGDTMVSDGDFYRQYLNGDDAGLEALMENTATR